MASVKQVVKLTPVFSRLADVKSLGDVIRVTGVRYLLVPPAPLLQCLAGADPFLSFPAFISVSLNLPYIIIVVPASVLMIDFSP